jgi:hypothetical protein
MFTEYYVEALKNINLKKQIKRDLTALAQQVVDMKEDTKAGLIPPESLGVWDVTLKAAEYQLKMSRNQLKSLELVHQMAWN